MNKISFIFQNLYFSYIFRYSQKILNLSKRKRIFQSGIKHFDKLNGERLYDHHLNLLRIALDTIDGQISIRQNEIDKILQQVRSLYDKNKLESAFIFLKYVKSEIKRNGLEYSEKNMQDLEKRIVICLELNRDLKKFDSFKLSQMPYVKIQFAYTKIMKIQLKTKNLDKNDSIHGEIGKKIQNIYDRFQKFMKDNDISQNLKYSGRFSIFSFLIDDFLFRFHNFRVKLLLFITKKVKSPLKSRKYISKAHNIVQKNSIYFSLDEKNKVLGIIKEDALKEENLINKFENILITTSKLMNKFKFSDAENQLKLLLEELKNFNLLNQIEKTEAQIEICSINKTVGNEIIKIEEIVSKQDILGAKSAIVKLKQDIKMVYKKENLIPAIFKRIQMIESRLNKGPLKSQNYIKKPYVSREIKITNENSESLFAKFKSTLLQTSEIEKSTLAKLLKISEDDLFERMLLWREKLPFELRNGVISLKINEINPKKNDSVKPKSKTNKKELIKNEENESLEDLDELLLMDFEKKEKK